ncbi:hypothetical protein ACJX0J_032057, partial [Zea mays]
FTASYTTTDRPYGFYFLGIIDQMKQHLAQKNTWMMIQNGSTGQESKQSKFQGNQFQESISLRSVAQFVQFLPFINRLVCQLRDWCQHIQFKHSWQDRVAGQTQQIKCMMDNIIGLTSIHVII